MITRRQFTFVVLMGLRGLHIMILVLTVSFSGRLHAQQPFYVNYNQSNISIDNEVFSLIQDSKGFIWFTNNNGLNRFDGVNARTFFNSRQSSVAGSCVKEDRYGRIWYENFDGYLHYVENNELKSLVQNPPVGFTPFGITDKYLFVLQKKGIDVYALDKLNIVKHIPLSFSANEFSFSTPDAYFCILDDVIYKIDQDLKLYRTAFFSGKKFGTKLMCLHQNDLYVISKFNTSKTIYRFGRDLTFIKAMSYAKSPMVLNLTSDGDKLWISTNQGVQQVQITADEVRHVATILPETSISGVFKDLQGNYWFSSTTEGIFMKPADEVQLYPFPQNSFNGILSIGHQFLIGDKRGHLYAFAENSGMKELARDSAKSRLYFMYQDPVNKRIFYTNSSFHILNGTDYKELSSQMLAVKEVSRINDKYYAVAASGILGLMKPESACSHQKNEWDPVFEKYKVRPDDQYSSMLVDRGKSTVYDSVNKTIYFLSNQGLFRCSHQGMAEILYNNEHFYGIKLIKAFDRIFALNNRRELYEINAAGHLKPYFKAGQYGQGKIMKVKASGSHMLVITENKLYVVNEYAGKPVPLNIPIFINEIVDAELYNDHVYLLSPKGILKVKTATRQAASFPKFVITEVFVEGRETDKKDHYSLDPGISDIAIHYSILNFGTGISDDLQYSLNGEAWHATQDMDRVLVFNKLAAGDYNLRFRLNGKVLTETISFTVKSPFYRRWWFIMLLAVAAAVLIYIYIAFRKRYYEKQLSLMQDKMLLEKELNQSILKGIKSQMNPHFFYNALNSIQSFLFNNDKRNASNYLAKFSRLTRMILEHSEHETIKLNDELEALRLYLQLENMRFDGELDFTIQVSPDIDLEMVKIPSMIIQPYVENAVKHGLLHRSADRKLVLSITREEALLRVVIDDNGIGRKRSAELNIIKDINHQSYANSANMKRLELLNRAYKINKPIEFIDKTDASGNACGTTVILYIPIS